MAFRRTSPRIQQQRSLTMEQVFNTNQAIRNDTPTEIEGMSVSEYTGNAIRAINDRRSALRRAVPRTNNLDELLIYQEALNRANEARAFIDDLRLIMQNQPPGSTVQDMRRFFQREQLLRSGFYVENPDGTVLVAVPEGAGSLPEEGAGSLPEEGAGSLPWNRDPSRFGSL